MIERFYNIFADDIGIDLGTANTLVYVKGQGVVITEPSVVAINERTGRVVAIGNDAKQMIGRTPTHISIIRPLVDGVISNFEVTEEMLAYFIRRASQLPNNSRKFFRPQVLVGVPSGITNVETRAVRDAARNAGARRVHIIEEPMSAAIGIRLPVQDPVGSIVVDIGGGTTDIAVISLGGIVLSRNLKVAGNHLNDDIVTYVRDEFKILLGDKTAEEVKIAVGAVVKQPEPLDATIRGRDLISGLPKEVVITDSDIKEAIGASVDTLVDAVKEVLEATPPEVISDIMHKGLVLTGGGALLRGMDNLLSQELKIPVNIADDPLTAVVRGTGVVLEDLDRYWDVLINEGDDQASR
ncbi:MAG: rod shape-determining protein [Patescibacteria group bacterium]|nr:rod shape-determining protein [Patescibacteria group bacterium]